MIISFCATQTIISWHKLEVAKSPLIIDQYAKVGIVLESWRAGDNDRHQDFQFWCRVSHEKWATRLGFNYLPITSAAHYSRMYSILRWDVQTGQQSPWLTTQLYFVFCKMGIWMEIIAWLGQVFIKPRYQHWLIKNSKTLKQAVQFQPNFQGEPKLIINKLSFASDQPQFGSE